MSSSEPETASEQEECSSSGFRLGHRPSLDGLRGIAVLYVLLGHIFNAGNPYFGVDLFFVLSGFLITSLLLKEFESHGDVSLKDFYGRRILRLLPALLMVIVAVFATSSIAPYDAPPSMLLYMLTYTTNFAIMHGLASSSFVTNPFTPTWSLAIEEQFYLFWPVIFLTLVKRFSYSAVTRFLVIVLLLGELHRWQLIAAGASVQRLHMGTDTHGLIILIGCILAFSLRSQGLPRLNGVGKAIAVLGVPLVMVGNVVFPTTTDQYMLLLTVWGVGCGYLMCAALLKLPVFDSLLCMGWLRYLGKISYGLYLYHSPIMVIVRARGYNPAIGALATLLVSAASYSFVEKPILSYKKLFQRESKADESSD